MCACGRGDGAETALGQIGIHLGSGVVGRQAVVAEGGRLGQHTKHGLMPPVVITVWLCVPMYMSHRDQVESLLLQLLPADVQKAHEQPLQPPKGVPLAVALRSKQLTGPRVSLQRYSLAQQWSKSLQQFWSGGQRTSSPASSSSLQQGPSSTNATAGSPEGTTAGGSADSQQAAAAPSAPSAGSVPVSQQPVLPQDKPIVAVVTAAGAIMQTNSAGPEAGGQSVVESHKLVRVLRGYRDNPQVIHW